MTPVERETDARHDAEFERMLLKSARGDELPADVSASWLRFGAALGSVGQLAAPGASPTHAGAGHAGAAALRRAARLAAAKWLVLGALAGSALTVVGMGRGRAWRGVAAAPSSSSALDPSAAPAHAMALPQSRSEVAGPSTGVPERASSKPHVQASTWRSDAARGDSARRARSTASQSSGAPDGTLGSTLGAQVALLDASRTAIAAGAFGEALRLTEQYQREFPAGELTPDAEVVALEALAARGDRDELAVRSARFLARYPADPHAARVKALAAR